MVNSRAAKTFDKGKWKNLIIEVDVQHGYVLAHSCTRFPCYLGMEINQCKDPMNNNKDCRVGQLTRNVPKEKMAFVSKSYFHILHSMVYNEHEI